MSKRLVRHLEESARKTDAEKSREDKHLTSRNVYLYISIAWLYMAGQSGCQLFVRDSRDAQIK